MAIVGPFWEMDPSVQEKKEKTRVNWCDREQSRGCKKGRKQFLLFGFLDIIHHWQPMLSVDKPLYGSHFM